MKIHNGINGKYTQLEEYEIQFAMTKVAIFIFFSSIKYTVFCNAKYRNTILYTYLQSKSQISNFTMHFIFNVNP